MFVCLSFLSCFVLNSSRAQRAKRRARRRRRLVAYETEQCARSANTEFERRRHHGRLEIGLPPPVYVAAATLWKFTKNVFKGVFFFFTTSFEKSIISLPRTLYPTRFLPYFTTAVRRRISPPLIFLPPYTHRSNYEIYRKIVVRNTTCKRGHRKNRIANEISHFYFRVLFNHRERSERVK